MCIRVYIKNSQRKSVFDRIFQRKQKQKKLFHFLYCSLKCVCSIIDHQCVIDAQSYSSFTLLCHVHCLSRNTCLFLVLSFLFISFTMNIPYFAFIIFRKRQERRRLSINSFIHSREYIISFQNIQFIQFDVVSLSLSLSPSLVHSFQSCTSQSTYSSQIHCVIVKNISFSPLIKFILLCISRKVHFVWISFNLSLFFLNEYIKLMYIFKIISISETNFFSFGMPVWKHKKGQIFKSKLSSFER